MLGIIKNNLTCGLIIILLNILQN